MTPATARNIISNIKRIKISLKSVFNPSVFLFFIIRISARVMMNAIVAAQSSHTFIYRGWEVTSEGNPYTHAILRGYVDSTGRSVSNYHYEDLLRVEELYEKSKLSNPSVIVDTNHNNSGKKYLEQIRIAKDIVHSRNQNADIKRLVKGLMIESYLEDGAQGMGEHIFGKSITDPCLGWEKTEQLIFDIAEKL